MGLRQLYRSQIHGLSERLGWRSHAIPYRPPLGANSIDKLPNMLITRHWPRPHVQPPLCIAFEYRKGAAPLFFGSPNWQNSDSCGAERSFADNFLQKQQKQWVPFQGALERCRSDASSREDRARACTLLLRLAGILLLFGALSTAKADDFAALVGGLASESFADKEKAVIALGALGDPRAVSILQALTDGRLFKGADGRVVISDDGRWDDEVCATR